jgi:GDP-L-fucose synthase
MYNNILVTGGTSMVGKHLKSYLPNAHYLNSNECDLRDLQSVDSLFKKNNYDTVIHLAAKVGGIMDNINNPVQFFEDNIYINTNTLKIAYKYGVTRFLGVLSTCIYPDRLEDKNYPLSELQMHNGAPTATNFSYGYAKRCLGVQIDTYNKQYNTKYNYFIPCNLYSEHDHFVGDKSHYVSSLIHKIALAKKQNKDFITLFGSGKPLRQFMYAEDFAQAIYLSIKNDIIRNLNIVPNELYSIEEIAKIALEACNANNLKIMWDHTKPDGQFRKDVSAVNFNTLFPEFKYTTLKEGIQLTYNTHFNELET